MHVAFWVKFFETISVLRMTDRYIKRVAHVNFSFCLYGQTLQTRLSLKLTLRKSSLYNPAQMVFYFPLRSCEREQWHKINIVCTALVIRE